MLSEQGRKPHVLTLIDVVGPGGAERIAEEVALLTDGRRFRRTVCVTWSPHILPAEGTELSLRRLNAGGVEVVFLNRQSKFDLWSMLSLVRVVRSGKVDLIHAHKFGSNVWGAMVGRLLGVPVRIAHEHTWSFEGQMLRRLIDRFVVARFSNAVIAVSDADRHRMIEIVKMPADRVVLVPNGIPDPGATDPQHIRAELGIASGTPVLVQTAVLRPQKAIGVMLAAMAALRGTHPDARLLVVGPGEERDLRQTAAELGVTENVSFLGLRHDVHEIIAAADIGVLSSDFEGMPLAVLEYMAAGLPVVATDVGGLSELVQDGVNGFLVPRRNPEALARRLGQLLDDGELRAAMGQRGRRAQQEKFSSEAMRDSVTGLYERLLAERGIQVPQGSPDLPLATDAA